MAKTIYPAYVPLHFYSKAIDGQGIFYRIEDMLVFYTMFSCIVREKQMEVISFCLMFNHFHLMIKVKNGKNDIKTLSEFERQFTRIYNAEYERSGRMFMPPSGWAVKDTLKKARSCIIYVCNNPVAGALCKSVLAYRWNLLAYKNNAFPYSDTIRKSSCSLNCRKAVDIIRHRVSEKLPMNYRLLDAVFNKLSEKERNSITDYIVSCYNFLRYNSMEAYFKDWNGVISVIESTQSAEYDLPEDYEDYSMYRRMFMIMKQLGYKVCCRTIENLNSDDIRKISSKIYEKTNAPRRQVLKFLHLTKHSTAIKPENDKNF